MSRLFLVLMTSLLSLKGLAQNSWKVKYGSTVLLQASEENSEKNVRSLSKSQFTKQLPLTVSVSDPNREKGWERFITVTGDNVELLRKKTDNLTVSAKQLRAWLKEYKTLMFHTHSVPTDPDLASRIRIRNVHLFTLKQP